jgi:hypothetical protein
MQNLASAGFSMLAKWGQKRDCGLNVSYQGEFGSGYMSNQVYGSLRKEF